MNLPLFAEGYTQKELERRPFAVETGYEEWGDQANHLVVAAEEIAGFFAPEMRDRINDRRLNGATVLAMDACYEVCELGFQTRETEIVSMPGPADLAREALGESYEKFQAAANVLAEEDESDPETLQLISDQKKMEILVHGAAEFAYIWGRHGDVPLPYSNLPLIIQSSGLMTVRPHATGAWAQQIKSTIQAAIEHFQPYQPSRMERLKAYFSEKAWADLQAKQGTPDNLLSASIEASLGSVAHDMPE